MPINKSITLMGIALISSACIDVTLGEKSEDTDSDTEVDTGGPDDTGEPGVGESSGHGSLQICFSDVQWDESQSISLDGTVVRVNQDSEDLGCSETVAIERENGEIITIGYTVLDADQADISPSIDLGEGQSISGVFESKCGWGCDAALVIEDESGIALIADQGHGLNSVLEGNGPFEVNVSSFHYNEYNEDSCTDVLEHSIFLDVDSRVELEPLSTEVISHQGRNLRAMAIAAKVYRDTPNCTTMDRSDDFSWLVYR